MSMYPRIESAALRPRRRWFVVAVAIALVGIAAGVGIFVYVILGARPTRTFGPGEKVTVHLSPNPRPGFYVNDAGTSADRCEARSTSGQVVPTSPISGSMTVSYGSTRWHVLSRMSVPKAGDYQVTCEPGGDSAATRYAVGTPPSMGGLVGAILAFILIPGASVLAAIIITIVTIVRRSNHRRRLLTGMR